MRDKSKKQENPELTGDSADFALDGLTGETYHFTAYGIDEVNIRLQGEEMRINLSGALA